MKLQFRLFMVILFLVAPIIINADETDGRKTRDAVIFNGGRPHRLVEDMPEGWYYCDTRMLTIEFPTAGFVPYTLSISSELNTLDYYVTSPLTSVYISPEVVEVDVQLATDGGDLYYGSFEATSSTLSE